MSALLLSPALQAQLADVESQLDDALQDRSALVTRMVGHTAAAGGKRVRPMLCLLAGAFGRPEHTGSVVRTAAGLELIHMATLVHDDVVDGAKSRRGRPAVSAIWGNSLAVLAGDWLFASSFELLYAENDPALIRVVARMVRELCAGAIAEVELAHSLPDELQPYYDRIYRKTAIFLETACRAGALAGGAPPQVQADLAAYGRRIGMAFQISDDILDFTGDPQRTGKPAGTDLRSGIATLPMLLGRRDPAVARLLDRTFGHARLPETAVRQVALALAGCGALAEARRAAQDLAGQGRRALRRLAGLGPTEPLEALADLAAERDH